MFSSCRAILGHLSQSREVGYTFGILDDDFAIN
jgi:hypothetical protein